MVALQIDCRYHPGNAAPYDNHIDSIRIVVGCLSRRRPSWRLSFPRACHPLAEEATRNHCRYRYSKERSQSEKEYN